MSSRYGLQIRTAAVADLPAIRDLLATAGHLVPPANLLARFERLRDGPAAVLLAEQWGPPSGLVVVGWTPTLLDDRPAAEISTLLVAPDDRRRGVGRALLKAASQAARSAGCDDLRMRSFGSDPNLAPFALATGFSDGGSLFVRPLRKRGGGPSEITPP